MKGMQLQQAAPIEKAPMRAVELQVPAPEPGHVRVHVTACGICRTDLHVIEGELPERCLPIIPGHQIVGRVDAVGDGVVDFREGERVGVAWLRHTCGSCRFCQTDRENLCEQASFTGYDADGGFAEYAQVPAPFAYRIPDDFDDVSAAPLLCGGIIGYRALTRAHVPSKGRLALFGFGSSAHVVLQIARHRGYRVFVVSRGAEHRQLARKMGAEWVGDNAAELPEKTDSAIVFAPAGELVPAALESIDKGGTVALAGIYMSDVPALDYEKHLFYEKRLQSVTSNTRTDGRALLIEAAAAGVRPHVTTYPLHEANRALQDLKSDRINGSGVLTIARS